MDQGHVLHPAGASQLHIHRHHATARMPMAQFHSFSTGQRHLTATPRMQFGGVEISKGFLESGQVASPMCFYTSKALTSYHP